MSDASLPKINEPYRIPRGFAKWHPAFTRLEVAAHGPGLRDIVITHDDISLHFTLDAQQCDELAAILLAPSLATTAQPATENVASGVV